MDVYIKTSYLCVLTLSLLMLLEILDTMNILVFILIEVFHEMYSMIKSIDAKRRFWAYVCVRTIQLLNSYNKSLTSNTTPSTLRNWRRNSRANKIAPPVTS